MIKLAYYFLFSSEEEEVVLGLVGRFQGEQMNLRRVLYCKGLISKEKHRQEHIKLELSFKKE